jgi:hypothetical protein
MSVVTFDPDKWPDDRRCRHFGAEIVDQRPHAIGLTKSGQFEMDP